MNQSLPFAAVHESARAGTDRLEIGLDGERVELLAERALFWPRERVLFVADMHLGKGATFRAGGVPIPRGATASDLARLGHAIARTGATSLVVLGDLLHASAGRVAALDAAFMGWRHAHAALSIALIRGNHDAHAGDPPAAWGINVVPEPHAWPPFLACHHPHAPVSGYALCGHVHPGIALGGRGRDSARIPCFLLGPRRALLPAFGRLTGLHEVTPATGERAVLIAGTRLFLLPPGSPRGSADAAS